MRPNLAAPALLALLLAPLGTAAALAEAPETQCRETAKTAYTNGFRDGVEAVNAQLVTWRDTVQQQVQEEVNSQLSQLQAQSDAQLARAMEEAQQKALEEAGQKMPSLSGALGKTSAAAPAPSEAAPSDPTPGRIPAQDSLPAGTTLTIQDPQNLPPDLYEALMGYIAG